MREELAALLGDAAAWRALAKHLQTVHRADWTATENYAAGLQHAAERMAHAVGEGVTPRPRTIPCYICNAGLSKGGAK